MALNFPSNPAENDIYQFGLLTYVFKNGKWVSQSRGASQLPWYSNMEQARALWKRLAAEAGLNLVDGSFEEGAEIASSSDVVWWQAGSAIYSWHLNEAKTVPAGSTPATTGGIGAGAWVDRSDATLRSELDGAITQLIGPSKVTADISANITSRDIIYAVEYGVVNSATVDSSTALQALIDAYPTKTIILPQDFALSVAIKYPTNCNITGIEQDHCTCWLLSGFTSTYGAAFEPKNTATAGVQYARISNITFRDAVAVADGSGTTSTLNGVELLGTYVTRLTGLKGVNINSIAHCYPGTLGTHQYTKRPILKGFDASNVNRVFDFEPATDNRLAYGDIFCSDIYTTGSVKYGARAEDTDGFTWTGSTMFPTAQLRVSGNYVSVSVCHPFEAMVDLADGSASAECFVMPVRAGGGMSRYANISIISGFSGRLTDDYNATVQSNIGADGISLYNLENFVLNATINDPSQKGLYLQGCDDGIINASIRSANTQDVGQVHEIVGTYDSVLLVGCKNVLGRVSDKSTAKRYAVYIDEGCVGCHIDVVSTTGTAPTPSNVRIPRNGSNSYMSICEQSPGVYKKYTSNIGQSGVITESSGATTPNCSYGMSGIIIRFDNVKVTNVTDIPDLLAYDEAKLHIQDNGATRFVSVANGGKFVWSDGSTGNKLGQGTIVNVMRAPTTGYLVQI